MFGMALLTAEEIEGLEQELKLLGGIETNDTGNEKEIIGVIYEDSFFGSEIGKYG